MRCTPIESTAVTTAGRPSGTAATASATPRISTSNERGDAADVLDEDDRRDHHDGDDDDDDARAACRRGRAPAAAASSRSGVSVSSPAMRPISVCMPVADDHRAAATVGDRRAAEDHVVAVAESRPRRRSAPRPSTTGRLSPVSAASAVCSAVDWITPRVGGNRCRLPRGGGCRRARPRRPGRCRRSPSRTTRACAAAICAQRRDRRLGPRLLDVAHHRVEQHDGEDGDRLVGQRRVALVEPEAGRDRRGDEQQDDEHVLELREELPPRRHGRLGRQLVPAVPLEPRPRLGVAQAAAPRPRRARRAPARMPVDRPQSRFESVSRTGPNAG